MYNNKMLKIEKSYTLTKHEKSMSTQEFYEEYVDVEKTIKSCKKCARYNKNWSCPPFTEDINQIWTKHDTVDLIFYDLKYQDHIVEDKFTKDEIDTLLNLTLHNEKRKILQEIQRQIKEEDRKDITILSSDYCKICPECAKISQMPCRYPKNMIHSVESVGVLVSKIAEELFDTNLTCVDTEKGKIPEHLNLLMVILYD